jgi:argininosuccinate lyase
MAQSEIILAGEIARAGKNSEAFERRLFAADARVCRAHCDALFGAGVLTRGEAERIKNGLQAIVKRAGYDRNYFLELSVADVQEFTETRLVQLVGETARNLNVGISRRDRAATVFRLCVRDEIEKISGLARSLQSVLVDAAQRQSDAVLPESRALETAQPILFAHWCMAHFERFARDRERLEEVWRRAGVMPLASGSAAGTNFEIDREQTARDLGFEGVSANSLDAATDDDYAFELVAACALLMKHLAKLSEELTALASEDTPLVEFPASFVMVSSRLESIRKRAPRIYGHQTALACSGALRVDSREVETAVFETVDIVADSLEAAIAVLRSAAVNERTAREQALKNRALEYELSDYLLHKNVPYRAARAAAEKIFELASSKGKRINDIALAELREVAAQIEPDVFEALTLERVLAQKSQIGGTAPERVSEALEAARASLEMEK